MRYNFPLAAIDIPEEWRDASTYHFVSPPIVAGGGELSARLAGRGASVATVHTSLILSRVILANGTSLQQTLAAEEGELRKAFPGFQVTSRAPWKHPRYGELTALEARFEPSPGSRVRQVRVFFVGIDQHPNACLTISCDEGRYEQEFAKLKTTFESIDLCSGR